MIHDENNYNWITSSIAIGNINSSYEPFDVIFNLAFDNNNVEHHHMKNEVINGKIIIRIGIYDSPDEYETMSIIFNKYIQDWFTMYKHKKILFHCHAGVSRSTTLAIAFLSRFKLFSNLSLNELIRIVKLKRNVINPNPGFIKALSLFINGKS